MTPASLLLLLLLARAASASTLAISASTVCGITAANATLVCAALSPPASAVVPPPFFTFADLSGGRHFFCALRSGATAFFCWDPALLQDPKRVYNGPDALAGLAVGADHIAAVDSNATSLVWWRSHNRFPDSVPGAYRSLASGANFTCAIHPNSSVRCWGPRAAALQAAFANLSASSLAAGGTHACAANSSGAVLCSDGATRVSPQNGLFGLAVGDAHACALRQPNYTAVCWALANGTAMYPPSSANATQFELLVAGGDTTCGLVTANFSVLCWSFQLDTSINMAPLPPIIPGQCVSDQIPCECGVYPLSEQLCSVYGGGVICNRWCDRMPQPPPATESQREPSKRVSKGWVALVVVGAVGSFAGVCSIVYCLLFGFCRHKKVHNSVQPTIADRGDGNAAEAVAGGSLRSPNESPGGSRSRSLFRRQRSRVMMTRQRSGPSSFKERAEEISLAELAAATNGFAADSEIGAGSFGTVYRGKLADGREVAIKRSRSSSRRESAFRSELAFLSRLHHKHLVRLVGYCEEGDERLLVYDYMEKGALYDHLHRKEAAASPVVGSWRMRLGILLDASRGIEYLHSYAVPPIIHRDIKSSNILLDAGWVARVSDFGLSLMAEAETTEAAAGTLGYMDPEYYVLQQLTVKSDVYGLGVVMLEVLTGKRAIFKAEDAAPVSVVDYAVPSIVGGELGKVLDARAPQPVEKEAEAVELVAYTAVHCVRREGKDRPGMADVVANLEMAVALCRGSSSSSIQGEGDLY